MAMGTLHSTLAISLISDIGLMSSTSTQKIDIQQFFNRQVSATAVIRECNHDVIALLDTPRSPGS
jgi:hypothetical protein